MEVLHISEAVSLAIHSLILVARDSERHKKVKELAEEIGISKAHLAKVFQRLAKAGFVSSVRGPRGGFALARPSHTITLLDIYEAIEAPLQRGGDCLLRKKVCPFKECLFGDMITKTTREFREHLASKTLRDFIS